MLALTPCHPPPASAVQVVLVTLGIDVSVEKRDDILASLLALSLAGLFIGAGATWLAVLLVVNTKQRPHNMRWVAAPDTIAAASACREQQGNQCDSRMSPCLPAFRLLVVFHVAMMCCLGQSIGSIAIYQLE